MFQERHEIYFASCLPCCGITRNLQINDYQKISWNETGIPKTSKKTLSGWPTSGSGLDISLVSFWSWTNCQSKKFNTGSKVSSQIWNIHKVNLMPNEVQQILLMSNQMEDNSKFLWSSHKSWTLIFPKCSTYTLFYINELIRKCPACLHDDLAG